MTNLLDEPGWAWHSPRITVSGITQRLFGVQIQDVIDAESRFDQDGKALFLKARTTNNTDANIQIDLFKNGTTAIASSLLSWGNLENSKKSVSFNAVLLEDDFIQVRVRKDSSGSSVDLDIMVVGKL